MKPQSWRPADILRSLCSPEERNEILKRFLQGGSPDLVDTLEEQLARIVHFRKVTLRSLPLERRLDYLENNLAATGLQRPLTAALLEFHFGRRGHLMAAFLDFWGIPNENGRISADGYTLPTPDRAAAAVLALQSRFPRREIAIYFATAGLVMGPPWQAALWPIITDLAEAAPAKPVEQPITPAPERSAEDAADFTTLDNLLIKTVVGALSDVEGTFTTDQAKDLVEEVIHLNQDRHRSYFHRGFLQVLTGDDHEGPFPESNASRRAWLLSGRLMALERKGDRAAIRKLFSERQTDIAELMITPAASPAAVLVCRPLFEALWEVQAYSEAVRAIPPTIAAAAGPPFLSRLLRAARDLHLAHRTAEAGLVLGLLERALGRLEDQTPPSEFLYEFERRQAQVLRAGGHFSQAEEEFNRIAADYPDEGTAQTLADVALCRGSFKWLGEAEVPRDPAAKAEMIARLGKAASKAEEALASERGSKTNAHYLLGVHALLLGDGEKARSRMEQAYAGMTERPDFYGDTLQKCRLYYALAILCSMHEAQLTVARELLEQVGADASFVDWPEWLLREALQVAHLAPAQGVALAEWIEKRFPRLLDEFLHNVDLVSRSKGLQIALKGRAANPSRQVELRWKDCEVLLRCARGSNDIEGQRTALDSLEELTFLSPALRHRFTEFLAEQANYDPAWSWEEAQFAGAQLLEADGRYPEAGAILAGLIHQYLSREEIDDARGLYDRLKGYGSACPCFQEVEARMEAAEAEEVGEPAVPADILATGRRLRVLFIGGNETQERYDASIVAELQRSYPRVEVTFFHTGWTSNWGAQADRIQQLMAHYDAAVLMRFVRTELGRRVRDDIGRLGKSWFPCTGHGRDWITRAILDAARSVAANSRN